MKPILLALVAIILLGGGGAGAYFYFKQPAEAATGAHGEHAKAEKAKKHGEHGAGAFVQLDPLILPVVGKDGLLQLVSLVIVIETPDEIGKQQVAHMSPRLKDAFIQDMYGALNQDDVMRGGIIEVTALKNRLHKVSERVMGEGVVNNVLLQVVQQRPM